MSCKENWVGILKVVAPSELFHLIYLFVQEIEQFGQDLKVYTVMLLVHITPAKIKTIITKYVHNIMCP